MTNGDSTYTVSLTHDERTEVWSSFVGPGCWQRRTTLLDAVYPLPGFIRLDPTSNSGTGICLLAHIVGTVPVSKLTWRDGDGSTKDLWNAHPWSSENGSRQCVT